ncbi:MAG: hypothetical protein ACFFDI_23580 [Promethearchaeota archaeon]
MLTKLNDERTKARYGKREIQITDQEAELILRKMKSLLEHVKYLSEK